MSSDDRIGNYVVEKPSFRRLLTMDAFDALPAGHPMLALSEVDVTEPLTAIDRLHAQGTRVSLFAFVVASIGHTLAEFPELNAVRSGMRIVRFDDVDVNLPVEIGAGKGAAPRPLIIRRAQDKDAVAIYAEIEAAREAHAQRGELGEVDRWSNRWMRAVLWFPKPIRMLALRLVMHSPWTLKRHSGTTFVTSVGKVAAIPGFVIPLTGGPRATAFALGSVVRKPAVVGDEVAIRPFLAMTLVFNHDLVDGAPAARFGARLVERIESAEGL